MIFMFFFIGWGKLNILYRQEYMKRSTQLPRAFHVVVTNCILRKLRHTT